MLVHQKSFFLNHVIKIAILMVIGLWCYQAKAASINTVSGITLTVTPERCVALHRGQTCYLHVVFTWQHEKQGDYCLVNQTTNKQMYCWSKQSKGEYRLDFQSTKSNDFGLQERVSQEILASTKIEVSWVYNSSKRSKSSWRLF